MFRFVSYIDAGSGSYLLAAIASGAAGTWFFIRSKYADLRGRGSKGKEPSSETIPTDQ